MTAGGPAAGQIAKNYNGLTALAAGTQNIPVETVTVSRMYLITDITVTTTSTAALLFQIQSNGVTIFQAHVNQTKGIEAIGIETQPFCTSGQPVTIVFPAGSGAVAWNVNGIEQ